MVSALLYSLSLHDALPIFIGRSATAHRGRCRFGRTFRGAAGNQRRGRSEEHTSELQSRGHLVCPLLLEKITSKSLTKQTAAITIIVISDATMVKRRPTVS